MWIRRFFFLSLLLCLAGFSLAAQAQLPLRLSAIQGVQFNRQAQILTLTSSEQLAPQIQYLKADYPGKIVLDIPNAVFPQVHQEIQAASQAITRIRISQFQNDPPTVRMVLDLQRPMEVNVRGRWSGSRYETRIEPVQASPEADPAVGVSGQQRLLQVRRAGQSLLLEGNAPLYPEIRRVGQSRLDYILTLYDVATNLTGALPQLRSELIAAASVSQDAQGVQIRLKLTRDDLELIPFSKDNICTLQLMVKANEQNLVRFEDLQVDELDRQTTRLRLYANDAFDFQVYPLEAPHRLVIDTLGTVLGQAGLERKLRSSQNLKDIRFLPQGDTQTDVRVVLDLHGDVHYQFDWQGKYLEVLVQAKVQRAPVLTPENRRALVVIDAGHGGNDPGAIGVSKQQEKRVTLEVSRFLQRYLENDGIQVIMTRGEDVEVLLQPRVDAANLRSADVFVSIHANSMPPGNTHVRGIETYYTTPQSKAFADTLHRYLVTQLGATDRRVRQRGLFVTRKATMPSVLLEIGFLSNPEEDALLANPNYQRKVAKAIRDGIHDYLTRHQKLKPQI